MFKIDELRRLKVPHMEGDIRVFGDSQIVIKWCLNLFKRINKASIYNLIMGSKQLVRRKQWRVSYRNVPRALNAAADSCCRLARDLATPGIVELQPNAVPADAPVIDLGAVYHELGAPVYPEAGQHYPSQLTTILLDKAGVPCNVCGDLHAE